MKSYVLFFFIVLISCHRTENRDLIQKIPIEFDDGIYNASKCFDVKHIPLDNSSKESLIGEVSKVLITDDRIFVLDRNVSQSVFIFDINGMFIKKISSLGKGVGEYIRLHDFEIDEYKDDLYLLDGEQKKILLYSLNGKFKSELQIDEFSYAICKTSEYFITARIKSRLYFWDKKGRKKGEISNKDYTIVDMKCERTFSENNDTSYVMFPLDNKIYRIENKTIIPQYCVDFGKYNINIEDANDVKSLINSESYKSGAQVLSFVCSNNTILFKIMYDYKALFSIYDINSNTSKCYKKIMVDNFMLGYDVGEFDNGIIFFTSSEYSLFYHKLFINNDGYIAPEFMKHITVNSNPILTLLIEK